MSADQKDRFIEYLVDKVNALDLDKRASDVCPNLNTYQCLDRAQTHQLTFTPHPLE